MDNERQFVRRHAVRKATPSDIGDGFRSLCRTPNRPRGDAWFKALKKPELLAEVRKTGMDMDPASGEELQIIDQLPEVSVNLKKILGL